MGGPTQLLTVSDNITWRTRVKKFIRWRNERLSKCVRWNNWIIEQWAIRSVQYWTVFSKYQIVNSWTLCNSLSSILNKIFHFLLPNLSVKPERALNLYIYWFIAKRERSSQWSSGRFKDWIRFSLLFCIFSEKPDIEVFSTTFSNQYMYSNLNQVPYCSQ